MLPLVVVNGMGKRGPKIRYHNEFHRYQREYMREYRARLKAEKHKKPKFVEVLA